MLPHSSDSGSRSLWQRQLLPVRKVDDIALVRGAAHRAALDLKLGLVDQTKLMTAAVELARNTLTYGLGGDVLIETIHGPRLGVRLVFTDRGPGIRDVERAMTDGFTTGGGMGLGLGGARRLMDEFEIVSTLSEGTMVTIVQWKR